MDTKNSKLNEAGKTNPFKVPEGYFERFSENLMSQLPERTVEEPKMLSLWERMRPWTYMAAMFVGIMLMFKIFSGSPEEENTAQNKEKNRVEIIAELDLEDFYTYYEDQAAVNAYRETLYIGTPIAGEDQVPSHETE
ncbi:hypothetical protein FACS1894203_0570 [Bacteroidia bacterium]|nr:hypothetical protein FACS1894203_0570 [Bacteroidia bacterium]GHT70614.1 hypothetical protein FACS189455_0670 [Bacteroidia bacterium]GHU91853.1 hypothetical protein FACS1894155_11890 [Bacteroidia bacterium]